MEKINTTKMLLAIERNCLKYGLKWRKIVRQGYCFQVVLEDPDGGTMWVHFAPKEGTNKYEMEFYIEWA